MDKQDIGAKDRTSERTVPFETVFEKELAWLTPWRQVHGRSPLASPKTGAMMPLAGLALSGGGIRSAAFSLGALQALDAFLAKKVEASSQPAGAVEEEPASAFKPPHPEYSALGRFDYLSTVSGGGYIGTTLIQGMQNSGGAFLLQDLKDRDDTQAVRHIRDHSRYLMPRGLFDLVPSLVVILRGIFVNTAMVGSAVVLLAALFVASAHGLNSHAADCLKWLRSLSWLQPFPVALLSVLVFVVLGYGWGLLRSVRMMPGREIGTGVNRLASWMFWLWLFFLVVEIQLVALGALEASRTQPKGAGDLFSALRQNFEWLLGVIGVLGTMFSSFLTNRIAADEHSASLIAKIRRIGARAALWMVSIILPALIWLAFLHAVLELQALTSSQILVICAAALILLLFSLLLDPNANSLLQLYRERLEAAFLDAVTPARLAATKQKFGPLHGKPGLHKSQASPLHVVNAALNIQNSPEVNKRGRNADFFSFSPVAHGSAATGFQLADPSRPMPDAATIMAVSGAAASSNMGSQTVRGLAPTLTLLNVRLGYWLANPRTPPSGRFNRPYKPWYLIQEMLSQLDESSPAIYLTDGGHIENLGLYELLRRRCELIVVVDAEADPSLSFASLITLQRYARLDLGISIDLPWQEIRSSHRAVEPILNRGELPEASMKAAGAHIAVGEIKYPEGKGRLIYIKSSMTGDENDYILDYKKRNPDFPHETTGDQFFSEDQFEAYRALGFHGVKSAFEGKSRVAGLELPSQSPLTESACAHAFAKLFDQ